MNPYIILFSQLLCLIAILYWIYSVLSKIFGLDIWLTCSDSYTNSSAIVVLSNATSYLKTSKIGVTNSTVKKKQLKSFAKEFLRRLGIKQKDIFNVHVTFSCLEVFVFEIELRDVKASYIYVTCKKEFFKIDLKSVDLVKIHDKLFDVRLKNIGDCVLSSI